MAIIWLAVRGLGLGVCVCVCGCVCVCVCVFCVFPEFKTWGRGLRTSMTGAIR